MPIIDRAAKFKTRAINYMQANSKVSPVSATTAAGVGSVLGGLLLGRAINTELGKQAGYGDMGIIRGTFREQMLTTAAPPGVQFGNIDGTYTGMFASAAAGAAGAVAGTLVSKGIKAPAKDILPVNKSMSRKKRLLGRTLNTLGKGRGIPAAAGALMGMYALGEINRSVDRLAERMVRDRGMVFGPTHKGTAPTRRMFRGQPTTSRVSRYSGRTGPVGPTGDMVHQLHKTGGRGAVLR